MNDPQLAAALRSRSPDALPELLDTYGDQLFSYCWRLLRNRENAQIAVRDALVIAFAQIGRLVCDEWLGLWLYSLARAECLRRETVPASDADEPVCPPLATDADSRLMTWKAVTSMPADEVEALELDSRPGVELRLVLGLSAAEVQVLLDRARRDLERALGTEILVRKSQSCPELSAVLSGWSGTTTPALRDRVLEHAATCSVCGPNLPRSVSPARLFALLPAPALSSVARLEILEFFDDSRMAAYREFTVSRAEDHTGSWFLSTPPPSEPEPATGSWFVPTLKSPGPAAPIAPETPDLPPATTNLTPAPEATDPALETADLAPEATDPAPDIPEVTALDAEITESAPGPETLHLPAAPVLVLEPAGPALRLAPVPVAAAADAATGPIGSGPLVAQGFMGSWLSLAEPADPRPGPVTEPIPPVSVPAPRPESSRPAPVPAPLASRPAPVPSASRPAPAPAPTGSKPVATAPPAGSGSVPPEPLAPVISLTIPPPAGQAPSRPSRNAGTAAAAVRPARRRPRVSRVRVAAVASVAVTAVFALVGFHVTPSASTAGSPPAVAAEAPGSASAPPAGGADAALPVKVKRSSGASSSAEPLQQSAANKTGSLAVAAASQPGTSSPSHPGRPGGRASSSSPASPSASSSANGSLAVNPARLDLGRGTSGELTLTAMNGPVSWSADTSSTQLTLSSQQGTLQAGQSVTLTVSVASGSGDEFVFVYSSPLTSGATAPPLASQAVEVTWATYRSRPSPSPSPSGSSSPSPSASPEPSSVMSGS